MLKNISLLLALSLSLAGSAAATPVAGPSLGLPTAQSREIRVLISQGEKTLKLTVTGGYQVVDLESKKELAASRRLIGVNIKVRSAGLLIAGVAFPNAVEIHSERSADLFINNRPFRGFLAIHRQADGTLAVVNHIDVEDYLYGVLFHEVGAWWPMESLKAQAIAARTYALYQKRYTSTRIFDVFNNQSSQMYGGADSERSRSSEAVDATRGEVLTFKGEIFPTYYHAACGGETRNSAELWNISLPPLSGGVKCEYCWFSPHYAWHAKVGLRDMENILKEHGVRLGSLNQMEVVKRSSSGRALLTTIRGSSGENTLNAKDVRLWVGSTVVRSENFEVGVRWGKAVFDGKGWGHGVGMCQWGALGQSILGKKHQAILGFYYPGAEIRQSYPA